MSCGVGRRRGLDPALLWLCSRPEAIAPIEPLSWESPYAAGAALEKAKRQEKKKRKKERNGGLGSSHCGAEQMNLTSNHEVRCSVG